MTFPFVFHRRRAYMARAITPLAGEIGGLIYARRSEGDAANGDHDRKANKTTINQGGTRAGDGLF